MIIIQHSKIVEDGPQTWVEPATGKCSCGAEVVLSDPLDNVCPSCGRCYNSSGQAVSPSWDYDESGEPFYRRGW